MFWRAPYIPMEGINDQMLYGMTADLPTERPGMMTEEPKQSGWSDYR